MRFNFKNSLLSLFILLSFVAQAQNGLNFQGVARNSNNVILASQPISLKLSIVQGTTNAVIEYTEVRKVTTNAQGLFNVVIGDTGTISVTGNFSTIDWKLTPKFLKIEMDVAAGNNFSLIGTTQFQSVAYAQFASQVDAEKIIGVVPVAKGGTGVASITALKASLALDTKVDKVTGKDLSTNDYTTAEKTKLAAITGTNTGDQDLSTYATNAAITLKENAANKSTAIDLGASATSDILFPTQKAVKTYVDGQINSGGVADGGILTRHIADGAVTGSKLSSEINGYKKFFDGAGSVTISNTVNTDVDVNTGSSASGGTSNWQSFTAGLSGKLSVVEFQTVNPSSSGPTPIAYVEIYSGQGLSGTLLGTSTNITISGFGRNWYAFDLNASNIRITSGSVYTARLVVNTANQNYIYGDNAIYNGGISNISSTWDLNIKTKIKLYSDDPYLTTSVATGLYGGLVSNATHTGDVTGATALTITDAAVTTSKIVNSAVDLTTKVTGLLPTSNIADAAVTTSKIANSAVDLTTKVTGSLPTSNIEDGAITTTKIANSAVDLTTKVTGLLPTSNIADGAITTAKIANSAVDLTTKVTGLLPTSKGGTGTITATANTFFASPDGTSGAPSFRGIQASDIPSNLSSYIQSTPMSPQAASIDIGGGARIGGRGIIGNDLYVNNIYMGIGGTSQNNTNTAIGNTSLQGQDDGYSNTTLGTMTMKDNNGGYNNTSIGANALQNINTGNDNTAIGNYAMFNSTTGNFNTATGSLALSANTSTANSGSYNVANGYKAIPFNQTGSYNVGIGYMALNSNTTGNNNTAIGNQANVSTGSLTNATAIGSGAIVSGSNQIQLGNSSVTLVQTSGGITAGGTLTANAGVFTSTTISGNASIGGTLSITGVSSFTSSPIFMSTIASKALFTNFNKEIVSNNITGTGDVVMSASPTLTGIANFENLVASNASFTELNISGPFSIGSSTASSTAALEVNSTTKGFLPPRMSTIQRDAIVSPYFGLTIYNTNTGVLETFSYVHGTPLWAPAYESHYIGESFGGGIVIYIYDNGKHGLIASTDDIGSPIKWHNSSAIITNATRDGINAGLTNTERIILAQGSGNYAAQACANYKAGNFGDWYLPSKLELEKVYDARNILGNLSGYYWSSTIGTDGQTAWYHWITGAYGTKNTSELLKVRAVRSF